jgi:hypothetical protein
MRFVHRSGNVQGICRQSFPQIYMIYCTEGCGRTSTTVEPSFPPTLILNRMNKVPGTGGRVSECIESEYSTRTIDKLPGVKLALSLL